MKCTLKTSWQLKQASHKSHIVYDSIYVKCPEEANLQETKWIGGCQELAKVGMEGWNGEWLLMRKNSFGGGVVCDEMF